MAVPKERVTSARRDRRRSHHALTLPTLGRCPRCRAPKPPHQVCRNCGTYRGREIIATE